MSLNMVQLIGFLGADPEIRRTNAGEAVATLRLATSETWRDKTSGERKERTEWHRIVVFNEAIAKFAEQYLKKGARVYVQGKLQTRKWTDQAGVEKYSTEVVLQRFNGAIESLDRAERAPAPNEGAYGSTKTAGASNGGSPSSFGRGAPASSEAPPIDDDIPF